MGNYTISETEIREFCGIVLHRVYYGEKRGGWIESVRNLSDETGDAQVSGNARVWGNARVSGNAQVWGNAQV